MPRTDVRQEPRTVPGGLADRARQGPHTSTASPNRRSGLLRLSRAGMAATGRGAAGLRGEREPRRRNADPKKRDEQHLHASTRRPGGKLRALPPRGTELATRSDRQPLQTPQHENADDLPSTRRQGPTPSNTNPSHRLRQKQGEQQAQAQTERQSGPQRPRRREQEGAPMSKAGRHAKTALAATAACVTLAGTLLTAATAAAAPPVAVTESAKEITRSSMTFCGTVDPEGE